MLEEQEQEVRRVTELHRLLYWDQEEDLIPYMELIMEESVRHMVQEEQLYNQTVMEDSVMRKCYI